MEFDDLIDELIKLRMFNKKEFAKRLLKLKENDFYTYKKVIKILNVDYSDLPPVLTKTKNKKNTNLKNVMITLIAVLIIGIALIGIMLFVLSKSSTTRNNTFNATYSLSLGYKLFNQLNSSFLLYDYVYNISYNELQNIFGREYYKLNKGDYSNVNIVNENICLPSGCSIKSSNEYSYFYKKDNLLLNNSCIELGKYEFQTSYNALNIYEQVYHYIQNGDILNGTIKDIWDVKTLDSEKKISCAPLSFSIKLSNAIIIYEFCLDNSGIPLAVAKQIIMGNQIKEVYIATLKSQSKETISKIDFEGKTLEKIKNNC